MSLSLYRKYRPETFTEVVGQEHIETTLKNAVETDSVSHAYLFCGPRGTGKTTTARLLAKALLCENAPTDHPDGTCDQCKEIADGLHPDVYELDAASRTGVENVREEIIGRVQFAPTRGSYKIYIIDEVHMLSTAAFNALLKTLEEPPSHVLFVLCTTDPHKVPDTIQSRCQRFDFHRLSEEEISSRLNSIAEQEGFTVEPEAISLIAQRSQGGMRDAIGALEQVSIFGGGTISFAAAESMLGEVSAEQLFSVSSLVAARDVAGCFAWVASFTQSGTDIAQFVRDLAGHIRKVYVASALGKVPALAEIIEVDGEQIGRYLTQAEEFGSPDRLANTLVVLGDLSTQLRSAANARLALEIALTRMARPNSDLSLESLAARIAVLEQGQGEVSRISPASVNPSPVIPETRVQTARTPSVTGTPSPSNAPLSSDTPYPSEPSASSPSGVPVPTSEPLTTESAPRLWTRLTKELVSAKKRSLATMLGGSSAHLDSATAGLLIELPTDAAFNKQQLERLENVEQLGTFVRQIFGSDLPLTFVLGAPSSNATVATVEAPPSASAITPPIETPPAPSPEPPFIDSSENPEAESPGSSTPSFEDMLSASFGATVSVDEIPSR